MLVLAVATLSPVTNGHSLLISFISQHGRVLKAAQQTEGLFI